MGCLLPEKVRPLYCRLFPFWVIDGRVGVFTFDLCLAQTGARSVNKVMKRLKMKTSQAISEIDAETITRHHLWMNTGANSY